MHKQARISHLSDLFSTNYATQEGKFEFTIEASTLFSTLFDDPSIWPESFRVFNGEKDVVIKRGAPTFTKDEDHELLSVMYKDDEGVYSITVRND